jgi:hypothetical protein
MRDNMDMVREFFTGKSDNYSKAIKGLKKVKETFDGFVIAFPDVTSDEIMLIKDKWENLPEEISRGVKIMALNAESNFKNILTHYNPNAYIIPHAHKEEYEFGRIIEGSVTDKLTGIIYHKNDEYKFTPNEVHYLSSTDGCVVYSVLTENSDYKLKSLSKKLLNKLESA